MRPGIGLLVAAFDQMNVLIIGDAMLDRYLRGSAQRLSQEAPVAIIDLERRVCAAGGAANAAMNAAALGAKATLISVVGEDVEAVALRQLLGEGRVGPAIVTDSSRHTLSKSRVVAGGHVLVRIDEGTQSPVSQETDDALCALITAHWDDADVIVLSDYGYGVCSPAVVSAVARQQIAAPRVLGVDSKRLQLFRNLRPSIVKPNYVQALALCGESVPSTSGAAGSTAADRAEVIRRLAPSILDRTGATAVAVTLDSDGAVVLDAEGRVQRTYAAATDNLRAIGAGDTYLTAFAMALGAGASTGAAASFASTAANVVVRTEGTSYCSKSDLKTPFEGEAAPLTPLPQLLGELVAARADGRRVVFTNGVFDIIHSGHVRYLEQARQLGDVLVVALNSDASARRLKGPARPINTLTERAAVLQALASVDYLVSFDEDTPEDLIRQLRPDVYVKGADYTEDQLPEAKLVREAGGDVVLLDYLPGHSTTSIVERIRSDPARALSSLPTAAGHD